MQTQPWPKIELKRSKLYSLENPHPGQLMCECEGPIAVHERLDNQLIPSGSFMYDVKGTSDYEAKLAYYPLLKADDDAFYFKLTPDTRDMFLYDFNADEFFALKRTLKMSTKDRQHMEAPGNSADALKLGKRFEDMVCDNLAILNMDAPDLTLYGNTLCFGVASDLLRYMLKEGYEYYGCQHPVEAKFGQQSEFRGTVYPFHAFGYVDVVFFNRTRKKAALVEIKYSTRNKILARPTLEAVMQVHAYAKMFYSTTGEKVEAMYVLHARKGTNDVPLWRVEPAWWLLEDAVYCWQPGGAFMTWNGDECEHVNKESQDKKKKTRKYESQSESEYSNEESEGEETSDYENESEYTDEEEENKREDRDANSEEYKSSDESDEEYKSEDEEEEEEENEHEDGDASSEEYESSDESDEDYKSEDEEEDNKKKKKNEAKPRKRRKLSVPKKR